MPSQSFDQDKELAEFFTDVEHLRDAFKHSVAAPTLPKRLLVIHGVGGVGNGRLTRSCISCRSGLTDATREIGVVEGRQSAVEREQKKTFGSAQAPRIWNHADILALRRAVRRLIGL